MPTYAFLKYESVPCPYCGEDLADEIEPELRHVTFQWGHCPSRYPSTAVYAVGDVIKWRPNVDGVVRGWVTFAGRGCNIGSPEISHLYVKDYGSDVANFPHVCKCCASELGGAAVEIEDGVVTRSWALKSDELQFGIETDVIEALRNGALLPRDDFDFKGFDFWEEAGEIRALKKHGE